MKIYLIVENNMCLNYINLHNSNRIRLRDTPLTSFSIKNECIFYTEEDVPKLKALHPGAEIKKFNSHYHLNIFRNDLDVSKN